MFSPWGCRRGFPGFRREPRLLQAGPLPRHAHVPQVVWDELPWEHQHRRGRGRWRPPCPQDPRPFPGSAEFPWKEEDRRWAPHDCPPPPPWDNGEDGRGPEDCSREGWHPPRPQDPRPFPGTAEFPWNEDRRWAPHDCPPPPPCDNGEDGRGPEDCFREGWHLPRPQDPRPLPGSADFPWNEKDGRWAPHDGPPPPHWQDRGERGREGFSGEGWHQELLPVPSCFAWPEFPDEDRHLPRPPASLPGEQGGFQDGCPSWDYRGLGGKRCRRLRRSHRELTLVQRVPCPWPIRGHPPSSRSSPSLCWPKIKEEPQHPDPSQPLPSFKDGAQSRKQTDQHPPAVSKKVPEPPSPASTPRRSPATDPQAATEAAEPEQAAGATPVEPGARQEPAGSDGEGPSASEAEPALPEQSSAGTGEHLEVEPCSQSVPKAGADAGSHPHGPTAPPEPAERVRVAASSAREDGAELCPRSQGQQHLPSGAGEAEAEAARDGLLGGHQPSENSQVPSGATAEPDTQPSQACSDICPTPETSPRTQHPPESGKTEPAAGGRCQLCSALLTSSRASADLRSAAVLARKEEIELSYQQFSLTIAVVATMLLQKEPSMEPALGLALRANLRQGRIHHLRELEDFINSYDSATLSR